MRKLTGRVVAVWLVLIVSLSPMAHAASIGGVALPETLEVEGKNLVLNGFGIREVTLLRIDVYVIALYLETRSDDAERILKSEESKRIVMHYLRDVSESRIRKALESGFKNNYRRTDAIRADIDAFLATVVDMKKGERVVTDLLPDRVVVEVKGGEKVTIEGTALQEAVLSVWLGPSPASASLKEDLVGRELH